MRGNLLREWTAVATIPMVSSPMPSPTVLTRTEISFRPPFCPNPACRFHLVASSAWRFHARGFRTVRRPPGLIRRFQCRQCRRWFSSSTFREDYWKKLPGLAAPVYHLIADGQGLRQAARSLGVSPTTVRRRQRWLAGQALLLHLEQERMLDGKLLEPVVLDGLRTFAGSQNEMAELNTLVMTGSGFVLGLDPVPLRRSGRMTSRQRRERTIRDRCLGRPDPRARRRASAVALARAAALLPDGRPLRLRTDEEPDYVRALATLPRALEFEHTRVSSRRRRDSRNPLWRVNHLHRLMRHSLANLKRETIAHSKTLAGLFDRALVHRCWVNNTKGLSERRVEHARTTPAMRLGLYMERRTGESLFASRRFPVRAGLPDNMRAIYKGSIRARPHEVVRPEVFKYAG